MFCSTCVCLTSLDGDMATIINELLCYILNKIDSVPQDTLVHLIAENFNEEEVEAAKSLLCAHVENSLKTGNRRGQNKKKLNIQDIYKMTLECDRGGLPSFVALNLAKLPPISIDCIDVSALMRKQQIMEVEMTNMKTMFDDLLKVSVETSRRVEAAMATNSVDQKSSYVRDSDTVSVQEPSSSACLDGSAAASVGQRPGTTPSHTLLEQGGRQQPGPGGQTATSYATVAAAATSASVGEGAWTVANRSKRGKVPAARSSDKTTGAKKSVVGLQKSNVITAVKSVKRVSLFVSRLPPGTDDKAVEMYVKEQTGAEDVIATKLQTRYQAYQSYRLDVTNPTVDDVLNPEIWAEGLLIRRFYPKKSDPATSLASRPVT